MIDKTNKCAYITETIEGEYECKILTVEGCSGTNTKCAFYKTKEQAIRESNQAIDICRIKGLCQRCCYREVACRKTTEVSA